jgi:hypothetical protein
MSRHKVWAISLCFNDPKIIRQSIDRFYQTKHPDVETVHILVDQHWPIGYANLRSELESICRDYRCTLLDPGRNLGLQKGFTWAWKQFAIPENAGVIGYDPDCTPFTENWDMSFCEVFNAQPDAAWLSLMNTRCAPEWPTRCERELKVAGHNLIHLKHPTVNSICMWRQSWLMSEGGIFEENPLYGGLESMMFWRMKSKGLNWYILKDVHEIDELREQENMLYREWKWRSAHLGTIPKDKDFATWLKEM